MQGIVISTSPSTKPFLEDLKKSLDTNYSTLFWQSGTGFELSAIAAGARVFDEFVYLHDTVIIKDNSLFDKLFAIPGHVAITDRFFHYFGKYETMTLPFIPTVTNKEEAVQQELQWFTKPYSVFENQLPVISDVFEEKHGRTNMRIENDFLVKFKARWQ